MGRHSLQTRGSGGAVAIKRVWPVWQALKISAARATNAVFFMVHILFALQGGASVTLTCPIKFCSLKLKPLDQARDDFQQKPKQCHLMVLPVWLVCTDQMALNSATKPVATAP